MIDTTRFEDTVRTFVSPDEWGNDFCNGQFDSWQAVVEFLATVLLMDADELLAEYPTYYDAI